MGCTPTDPLHGDGAVGADEVGRRRDADLLPAAGGEAGDDVVLQHHLVPGDGVGGLGHDADDVHPGLHVERHQRGGGERGRLGAVSRRTEDPDMTVSLGGMVITAEIAMMVTKKCTGTT